MDIAVKEGSVCYVNNKVSSDDTKVYENFEVNWEIEAGGYFEETNNTQDFPEQNIVKDFQEDEKYDTIEPEKEQTINNMNANDIADAVRVIVNGEMVTMTGKDKYVFVDVFSYISFDLSKPQGVIVTTINGRDAGYMEELHNGDVIEIYWRKP